MPEDHCIKISFSFFQCWKSSIREKNGEINHGRGCSDMTRDEQMEQCSNNEMGNATKLLGNDTRLVDCCNEDLCNGGPFPIFQEPEDSRLIFEI